MSGTSSDSTSCCLGMRTRTNRPGCEHAVLVVEHGAAGERAGAGIDLRRDVVERAGVRIALLGLQADVDRDRTRDPSA